MFVCLFVEVKHSRLSSAQVKSEWSCTFTAGRKNTQHFRPKYIFVRFDGPKPVTVDIGVVGYDAVAFGRLMSAFRGNLLHQIFQAHK